MPRNQIRKAPRHTDDRMLLQYDFAPRLGWGTYPSRGERNGNVLVWEDRDNLSNQDTLLHRLSDESLQNLVTAARNMGMVNG